MSIDLRWHPTLPVLVLTLSGVITDEEYQAMCRERADMLSQRSDRVLLLVDMGQLDHFENSQSFKHCQSAVRHTLIYRTLIVLPPRLYRVLNSAISDTANPKHTVWFYPDVDRALAQAADFAGHPL